MKKNQYLLSGSRQKPKIRNQFFHKFQRTNSFATQNIPNQMGANNFARRIIAPVVFIFAVLGPIPFASAQTCRWDGTAPLCGGTCRENEIEVTRLSSLPDFWVRPFVNTNPPFGEKCL